MINKVEQKKTPYLKAYENVMLPMLINKDIPKEKRKEKTIALLQKLGLDENVIFCGETKNPTLLYQAMDCFVMPSLGAEGLPLTALEAQCSGLPCFLADTIPSQTAVVNTIFIPLEKGAAYWADQIWRHSTNFVRKDESHIIAQKGFSTQNMLEYVKVKYFDSIYVEK